MRIYTPLVITVACVWLWPAPGRADSWIEVYSYDFGSTDLEEFSGTDGWESGYSEDAWSTAWIPGEVNPRTDDEGGSWSDPDPISNHLTQAEDEPWIDVAIEVQVRIVDLDTIGVVVRKWDDDSFYLFFMTLESAPSWGSGGGSMEGTGAYLYRVRNGNATRVAANENPEAMFVPDADAYQRLRMEMVGDTLRAYYDTDLTGDWDPAAPLLSYTDDNPLSAGRIGLYAYNTGEGTLAEVGFRHPTVYLADSDDDGWANDRDCDPHHADVNPDATELCDDGIDNDCDGDVDAEDDDCGGSDDDDDSGAPADDDGDDEYVLLDTGSDCSCRQTGSSPGAGPVAVTALLLLLMRRR